MQHDTIDALKRMKVLLAKEETWCKKASALDQNLRPVSVSDPRACSWCLWGASVRSTPDNDTQVELRLALRRAAADLIVKERNIKELGGVRIVHNTTSIDIVHFNDDSRTTHEDVIDVIDRAIAAEEEKLSQSP